MGDVFQDSPAGKAGLQRGDIVRTYDGVTVKDPTHLRTLVAETSPNNSIKVGIWRNGRQKTLSVHIGEMPKDLTALSAQEPGAIAGDHALSGLLVEPVKPGQSRGGNGVAVSRVKPDSPAAQAGVRTGDIILEINRKEVHSLSDFEKIAKELDASTSVLVLIQRGKGTIFLTLKP